jgi:hypothetical protein
MYRSRWFILGALLSVAALATTPHAFAQAVQVKAAPGDLPPDHLVISLWHSPTLRDAVLAKLNLELVETVPDPRGSGGQIMQLKDKSGQQFEIALSFSLQDESVDKKDATSLWGMASIYPYQDGTTERTKEQEKELTQLCSEMTVDWAEQLEMTLREFAAEGAQRDEEFDRRRLALAEMRLDEAKKELETFRVSLHDVEHQVSMPAAVLETQLSEAMSQLQSLELELAGLQARREAIEVQLATVQAEALKHADVDEVAAQLQSVVEIRQRELELVKQSVDVGKATPIELEMVKGKLATAKAEYAEAKRDAMKSESGATLDWLRNDLAQCIIRQQECIGKRQFAESRATKLSEELRTESMLVQPLREKCALMARRVESLEDAKHATEMEIERDFSQRQSVQVRLLMPRETEKAPEPEQK